MNNGISFWYASAGYPSLRASLPGDVEVDDCIVGGGFTGLWSAYYLKRERPDLEVAVVERAFAGYGASGRNGGWMSAEFNGNRVAMARRHGVPAVVALARAMQESVDEVLGVCDAEGIDADQVTASWPSRGIPRRPHAFRPVLSVVSAGCLIRSATWWP